VQREGETAPAECFARFLQSLVNCQKIPAGLGGGPRKTIIFFACFLQSLVDCQQTALLHTTTVFSGLQVQKPLSGGAGGWWGGSVITFEIASDMFSSETYSEGNISDPRSNL
jgi:hypothetical protein